MVVWRRKNNPDMPIRAIIGLEGFNTRDRNTSIPIHLTDPIQVNHVIERKPIPRPDYIRVQIMMPDGTFHEYICKVGHFYESGPMHIPQGATDVRIQYHFGDN